MYPRLYLRPVGLVEDVAAYPEGVALPLAGGPLGFLGAILLSRSDSGSVQECYLSARELATQKDESLLSLLSRVTSKRHPPVQKDVRYPLIMGIVNITPDSFSGNNESHISTEEVVEHARGLIAAGADILDLGGESTRPGAVAVDADEEAGRVMPVLRLLRGENVDLSVDTRKSAVMEKAMSLGVRIINDVSGLLYDSRSLSILAAGSCKVVLVHSRGLPGDRYTHEGYDDVVLDVYDTLEDRVQSVISSGISRERLIIDPGIGFGKTWKENLHLLKNLSIFHGLGLPLMLGVSRKRTIGILAGVDVPADRDSGSLALGLAGIAQGVGILRVHDVAMTRQGLACWSAAMGWTVTS